MWISTLAPFGDVTPRNFEVCASHSLPFSEKTPIEYGHIFSDGKTCIEFEYDLSNFVEKFHYYLKNKREYMNIVSRAYSNMHDSHTWKHRAQELLSHIRDIKNEKYNG